MFRIYPKAIAVGFFVSMSAFIGISILFEFAVLLMNFLINQISMVPFEMFIDAIGNSPFVIWTMNLTACTLQMFSGYLTARMSIGSEWINAFLAYISSLSVSLMIGCELDHFEALILIGAYTLFTGLGVYLSIRKRYLEENQ